MIAFVKDLSIIIAGAITLITFVTGVFQYIRQGHQHRATQFVEMRRRFLENEMFRQILNQIAMGDPGVKDCPIQDRRNLVGFLEEVALMMNSRLIKPEVAHYMFGHYAIRIHECEAFWDGLDKQSMYWDAFHRFVAQMKQMERDHRVDRKALSF